MNSTELKNIEKVPACCGIMGGCGMCAIIPLVVVVGCPMIPILPAVFGASVCLCLCGCMYKECNDLRDLEPTRKPQRQQMD